ncbi:hypothetical protein GWN63_02960 [Candidatus Bathyarchaeota archaeon]|nr:hypothetical protein [Candidatus Bathyarchaeota archaeon]NIR15808.1 hypothetical protein [Desulfobacterales bacterium]NIU81190.1 hypothetical protein [Candidatus Bathyarchaeota archaeon]
MKLFLAIRKPRLIDTKKQVSEVIHRAQMSLEKTEPPGPFRIVNLNLVDVIRKDRGYDVIVRVDFEEAISQTISIPGRTDVVS